MGRLIQVVIAAYIALPLGTWWLLADHRNDATRGRLIGISFDSLSICAIALRPWIHPYPSTVLAMVLICFGYWGFCLERVSLETSHAQQGQRQAETESETMCNGVKERDRCLILHARVSSLSSLSS